MFVGDFKGTDAVDPVDGWVDIIFIGEFLFPVDILQECRQIKIILREQDPYRLNGPFYEVGGFHALVLDLHDMVILYGLRDVPETWDDGFSVMWFDVVELFVRNE